jgi:hypothetical protein
MYGVRSQFILHGDRLRAAAAAEEGDVDKVAVVELVAATTVADSSQMRLLGRKGGCSGSGA